MGITHKHQTNTKNKIVDFWKKIERNDVYHTLYQYHEHFITCVMSKFPKHIQAIRDYKMDSTAINNFLVNRQIDVSLSGQSKQEMNIDMEKRVSERIKSMLSYIHTLDSLICAAPKLKRQLIVYRGMDRNFIKTVRCNRNGITLSTFRNFVSTTVAIPVSLSFGHEVLCTIILPVGSQFIMPFYGLDAQGYEHVDSHTMIDYEREVLLPRNCTFEILKVELIKDTNFLFYGKQNNLYCSTKNDEALLATKYHIVMKLRNQPTQRELQDDLIKLKKNQFVKVTDSKFMTMQDLLHMKNNSKEQTKLKKKTTKERIISKNKLSSKQKKQHNKKGKKVSK